MRAIVHGYRRNATTLPAFGRRAIRGPGVHQLAALVEQIAAPVGRFGLVLDHMCKCGLANFIREIGTLGCPIAKGGAETVHRRVFYLHAAQQH